MEYNLTGTVSPNDYIQFNKFHRGHGFLGIFRLVFFSALLIFLAFTFTPTIKILINILKVSPFNFIKIVAPLVVVFIFLILYYIFIIPLICKRYYKANKTIQQLQNIKINEQLISITTESGYFNLTKSNINKIKYDKDSIYIYSGLNMANIIKKRFLENENDFEELVNFVKLNYGKKMK